MGGLSGSHRRAGISVADFMGMFPDDRAAERWFEYAIWGEHPRCPRCGCTRTSGTRHRSMPHYCSGCHKRFSVRIGTVMERTRIGYRKWAIAVYLVATSLRGVSSMKLHRDLGITQQSAWFLAQRLRESWLALADGSGMQYPKPRYSVTQRSDDWTVRGDDLEAFWVCFHRGRYGTFYHMSPKHEGRYAGEFAGRLNVRPLDTIDMMGAVAVGMVGRRLTYARLTG